MISIKENTCPLCQSKNSKRISSHVMECSGQDYRECKNCNTKFVDTYLLDHLDENEKNTYNPSLKYKLDDFALEFDFNNPNSPIEYYPELEGSNQYLLEAEGEAPYIQDYLLAEDIHCADQGVLNIIDLKAYKIYFNDGNWRDIEKKEI